MRHRVNLRGLQRSRGMLTVHRAICCYVDRLFSILFFFNASSKNGTTNIRLVVEYSHYILNVLFKRSSLCLIGLSGFFMWTLCCSCCLVLPSLNAMNFWLKMLCLIDIYLLWVCLALAPHAS